jgi:hypothetical protein
LTSPAPGVVIDGAVVVAPAVVVVAAVVVVVFVEARASMCAYIGCVAV